MVKLIGCPTTPPLVESPTSLADSGHPTWAVFDIEARRCPPDRCSDEDFIRLSGGASCICVWDSSAQWPRFYDDSTAEDAADHLESVDLVIGWNSLKYDVPLLALILGRPLRVHAHFDLKRALVAGLAIAEGEKVPSSLGLTAKMTLGADKNGSGGDIERLISANQWARLLDYCANDVKLVRDLVFFVLEHGYLVSHDGSPVPISIPVIRGAK